jgi:tetratricopeptide (TPR) repeat protein
VSLKSLSQFDSAALTLKSAFEAAPTGPMAEQTLFQWADCELRAGHHEAAREKFFDLVKRWPKGEFADDSLHFAGESALLSGKLDDSEKLLAQFQTEFAASPLRLHQQVLRGRLADARGREFDAKGNAAEAQKRYEAAVNDFDGVIKESKLPRTIALARFHLARTLQKQGNHAKAVEALGPLVDHVNKEGESSEFIDALVMLGRSEQSLGKFQQAGVAMSRYLTLRPKGEQADQALLSRERAPR